MKKHVFLALGLITVLSFGNNLSAMYKKYNDKQNREFARHIEKKRKELPQRIDEILQKISMQKALKNRKYLYKFKLDSTKTKLIPYYKDYSNVKVHYKDEKSAISLIDSDSLYLISFMFDKLNNKVTPCYINKTSTIYRKPSKDFCWWY